MRYEDWDILIFPSDRTPSQDSGLHVKVPLKEFKVACHVVPDIDTPHAHGSSGIPVMTCFVPSLPAGTPFHVSIHSWRTPGISQYTKSFSKHRELVKFEARIFIDGRLASSTAFPRTGEWPYLITNTFEFTKTGELEPFRFPNFRRELLYHSHWHPGDDIGRIKIVISEGFPRDSLTNPIERVKNVVAFSFQHAPLDILEANNIAWPNPQMWKRATEAQPVPNYRSDHGAESHRHSPRRQSMARSKDASFQTIPVNFPTSQPSNPSPATGLLNNPMFHQSFPLPHQATPNMANIATTGMEHLNDPAAYIEWCSNLNKAAWQSMDPTVWGLSSRSTRKHSSTDTSMPDYSSSGSGNAIDSVHGTNSMVAEDDFVVSHIRAPTNTPTVGPIDGNMSSGQSFSFTLPNSVISADLAASLTHSLLNQPHPLPVQPHMIPLPASEVKSRKETHNRNFTQVVGPVSTTDSPCVEHLEKRNFSQVPFVVSDAAAAAVASCMNTPVQQLPIPPQQLQMLQSQGMSSRVPSAASSEVAAFSAAVSRAASMGDFAVSVEDASTPAAVQTVPPPAPSGSGSTPTPLGVASQDRCNKRARHFTPASTKAIDDEDEPRRVSPRLQMGSFAGEGRGSPN